MTRDRITRRAALRGLGVAIGLPAFESLLPRARADRPPAAPLRLCYVYAPNGKHMADWTPPADGPLTALPPTLAPLEPVRDRVAVLSGLCLRPATDDGPGDHARAMAAFLTGVRPHKTSGADVRAGVSADQVAAGILGRAARLPSLLTRR